MFTSTNRKTVLSKAVVFAIGISAFGPASADTVATFVLKDFNNDGLRSDFGFANPPPGDGGNVFGIAGEIGCTNATNGNDCDPIDMLAGPRPPIANNGGVDFYQVLEFTTGFNFGGGGDFNPNIADDINATIDPSLANAGDGQSLQFGVLDFGGIYQAGVAPPGNQFFLAPDHLQNCTGQPPGAVGDPCGSVSAADTNPAFSNPLGYNVDITDLGSGDYGVVLRYVGTITGTGTSFDGNQANWRIEGVMSLVDEPPVVTVDGADPLTVIPDTTYTDPGASCFDGVDGAISSPGPGIPSFVTTDNNAFAPLTGPAGNSFTVTYTCTDSANQEDVKTRTVNSGSDIIPPIITLLAADPVNSIPDRLDTVDGTLVQILQNVPYTDLGAVCTDNTGDIPFPTTGPGALEFTVDDDTVDTSILGSTIITFTCNDAADNGPVQSPRTVTVERDTVAPSISLPPGDEVITVSPLDSPVPPSTATCVDTNQFGSVTDIPLGTVGQPGFLVNPDPNTIDTSVPSETIVTYTCVDAFGNETEPPVEQLIRVVASQSYEIKSMTISDVDADGVAGCFRFESLQADPDQPGLCDLANRFSSDGSVTGPSDPANMTLPGPGTDLENGEPIGIRFGSFQDVKEISQGFNFSNFPFLPFTFDPPSKPANFPSGFVNIIDEMAGEAVLDIRDFPFSGLYDSNAPNEFILDPDPGTLSTRIFQINNDDDGVTRTFFYDMSWSHRIGPGANPPSPCPEDPTGSFCGNNAFFRLEGVVTVNSVPVIVNNPPVIHSVTAAQDILSITRIVVATDGLVTVTTNASDPDGDNLSFDWSRTDSSLTPINGYEESTFVFNPDDSGFYTLRVDVTDDADQPLTASSSLLLDVRSKAPELGDGDTSGNGISDADEGYGDDDDDGIPNYQDAIDGSMFPARNLREVKFPDRGEIVSSDGRVQLGDTAFKTGRGSFIVKEDEVGVIDRVTLVDGLGHSGGGIYDFKIANLPLGAAVRVVLPQRVPLPAQSVYRKFSKATGWGVFSTAGLNALASARGVNGACPHPDSSLYNDDLGLVKDDDCVRLTIEEGGQNDGDAVRNGVVADPGVVARNGPARKGSTDGGFTGSGGSGGCAINVNASVGSEWLFVLMFLGGLGVLRRKNAIIKVDSN